MEDTERVFEGIGILENFSVVDKAIAIAKSSENPRIYKPCCTEQTTAHVNVGNATTS